jgi:hypothetical protein
MFLGKLRLEVSPNYKGKNGPVLYDPRSLKKGLIQEICSVMMSLDFYVV